MIEVIAARQKGNGKGNVREICIVRKKRTS
jgi:hypothetical protein